MFTKYLIWTNDVARENLVNVGSYSPDFTVVNMTLVS